ncbi:MAG: hypothetical protein DMF85_09845 [Acidobacteria bacterium]|nr:MAG: hypothetical protein DMF85_09845 [Acidobacteriota bacterium]
MRSSRGGREVSAQPVERRLPRRQWIRFGAVRHVAHRDGKRREVVLDPQELQRILAVAFADRRLPVAEVANLREGVDADGGDRRERERHAGQQQARGRVPRRLIRREVRAAGLHHELEMPSS